MRYEVISPDVWGNARDGWEINDMFRVGEIDIPDTATMPQLRRMVLREFFLKGAGRVVWFDHDPHGSGEITVRDRRRPRIPADPEKDAPGFGHGRPLLFLRPE